MEYASAKSFIAPNKGGVNASTKIARKDLANFILKTVEDTSYDGQMPFVSW